MLLGSRGRPRPLPDAPARPGRGGAARLAVVVALLCGLFLMHGAPASAAGGCHGDASTAMSAAGFPHASARHAPEPHAPEPSAATRPAPRPPSHPAAHAHHFAYAHHFTHESSHPTAYRASYGSGGSGGGGHCLARIARDGWPGPAADAAHGVAAVPGAVLAPPTVRAAHPDAGLRGPPGGGRELLLRVSVART